MKQAIFVTGGLAASLVVAGCASPSRSQGSDEGVKANGCGAEAALCASEAAVSPTPATSSAGGDASALPAAVAAQPVAPAEKWQFSATPYMWFAGVDVGMSARGRSGDAKIRFGDIWDNLDMAAMAHIEASKGKWSFFVEGLWLELSDNTSHPSGDVRVSVKELIAGGYAAYQIVDAKFADSRSDNTDVSTLTADVYGGARYTDLRGKVNPTGFASERDSMDWVDPVVGLRGRMQVTPEFALVMRGDVGGWSGADDASWYFLAGFDWQVCQCASLGFGYAVLTERYREGSDSSDFTIKEKISGPYVALTFRF